MRVLVTGAAGFIGRASALALLRVGHHVVGVDRNLYAYWGEGYSWKSLQGDVTSKADVDHVFKLHSFDAVLHLAANSSLQRGIEDPHYDAEQNILGTINVIEATKRHGCGRIVLASTSAVYGPTDFMPLYCDQPLDPITPYGIGKAAGEWYCRASGLSWCALRYGNVYGPGQRPIGENILIARALAHMLDGQLFQINGDGSIVRDWIYIDDVVSANIAALESEAIGAFNVATGVGTSVADIVDLLAECVNYSGDIVHGPSKSGELPRVIMDVGQTQLRLGWEPRVVLTDGLRMTAEAWTTELER